MEIKADGKKLEDILKESVTFVIPDYQRPYSWNKNNIEDLFNDLEEVINLDNNHYFGAFVFNMEKENEQIIEVIDGQQRLTTVIIFLYVLLYLYNLDEYKNEKGVAHRFSKLKEYLEFLDNDGEIIGIKLQLGEANNEFFKEFIVEGWNKERAQKETIVSEFKDKAKYNASKTIKETYDFILDKILLSITGLDSNDGIGKIKEYHDTLLGKFEVVEIRVKQDADAFLIFETLNDRGLALSSVDLIKNKLFKHCAGHHNFSEIKEKWIKMIESLDDISLVKKYLRHYWISKYEHTSSQGLFKSFRDKVNRATKGSDMSKTLISDLYKMSIYYQTLNSPNNGVIGSNKLINVLIDMNALKFDLMHPIILSGFRHFKDDEDKLYKLSKLCLNFLIRYISFMKQSPGGIEKIVGDLSRELKTDISIISDRFKEIAKDSEFKEAVKNYTAKSRGNLAYYVLTEYEKTLHTNEDWVAPTRSSVTLEHVLPQTIENTEWVNDFTKDEHDIYVNRLGNLTLLGPKGQGKARNYKFNKKKDVYKLDTDMKITQELCKYNKWTKKIIDKRQNLIAEKLVDIFTLDIDKL